MGSSPISNGTSNNIRYPGHRARGARRDGPKSAAWKREGIVDAVPPAWLADRFDGMRMVDVRDGWESDGIEHLPDAVSTPFDEFRSADGDVEMLPGRDTWIDLLSDTGVTADNDTVAYGDTHDVFVMCFLVTAFLYGYDPDRFHLPDGGFSAWNREREMTTGADEVTGMVYEITEPVKMPFMDLGTVEAVLDDPETIIVDTRDPAEYGEEYLPGAINLDRHELVDGETRGLKPRDEFDTILDAVDVAPDRQVVFYCNTARRISHIHIVLSHLGYGDVAFYEGSLTEWEERDGAVVEG